MASLQCLIIILYLLRTPRHINLKITGSKCCRYSLGTFLPFLLASFEQKPMHNLIGIFGGDLVSVFGGFQRLFG
jgi:hypothetical protein